LEEGAEGLVNMRDKKIEPENPFCEEVEGATGEFPEPFNVTGLNVTGIYRRSVGICEKDIGWT